MGPTMAILPEDAELLKSSATTSSLLNRQDDGIAAAAAANPTTTTTTNPAPTDNNASPRLSSSWDSDNSSNHCSSCHKQFDAFFQRKHHCRLCGKLFCHDCSSTRSLIPPSAIVLKNNSNNQHYDRVVRPSFLSENEREHTTNINLSYVVSTTSTNTVAVAAAAHDGHQPPHSSNHPHHSSSLHEGTAANTNHGYDDTLLLYGRGLEQRVLAARHPQRTCRSCSVKLLPLQQELCLRNSNAMRYNYINEGDDLRKLCNSPLAFTLGHEVRKAAYALGNLLPQGGGGRTSNPRRRTNNRGGKQSGFVPITSSSSNVYHPNHSELNNSYYHWNTDDYYYNNNHHQDDDDGDDKCHIPNTVTDTCQTFDPTFRNVDGGMLHIPSKLLNKAKGVAIVTCCKGGLGFAGFEFGTGLVVARRDRRGGSTNSSSTGIDYYNNNDDWSAPSAIGILGLAWGALLGAQISDHVFLLMTDDAVRLFASDNTGGKSIHLGVDIGVAVGPLGRSAEADFGAGGDSSGGSGSEFGPYNESGLEGRGGGGGGGFVMAPIFTYSLSRGLYAGVSLDGRVLMTRDRVNEKFYGRAVSPRELLLGHVPRPPAAQPLYDALKRCRVYGTEGERHDEQEHHRHVHYHVGDEHRRNTIMDEYHGRSAYDDGGGGFLERLSHTTGVGLSVSSSSNDRHASSAIDRPFYNLSSRTNNNLDPVVYY